MSSRDPVLPLAALSGCGLLLCPLLAASEEGVDARLERAKQLFTQGAYEEACRGFAEVLQTHPDDPWAGLYRTLCERRQSSAQPFPGLSLSQFQSLTTRLQQEEETRQTAAVQRRAIERELREEQMKWERALASARQQAEEEQRRRAKATHRAAIEAAKRGRAPAPSHAREAAMEPLPQPPSPAAAEGPAPPDVPQPSGEPPRVALPPDERRVTAVLPMAPGPPSVSEPPPPEVVDVSVPVSPAGSAPAEAPGLVELPPVVVPTPAGQPWMPAPEELTRQRRLVPAGAVRINARQMRMSPEKRMAVAEGSVEVFSGDAMLTADQVTLFTDTHDVYAEGRVRLEQGPEVFRGDLVHYNLDTKKGRFFQGTVSSPPWHEHGRSVEQLAEGVFEVTPGYLTSCDQEPPHYRFSGRRAIVFAEDRSARARNVALFIEQVPLLYIPWLSVAERRSPFFLVPGKKKPWEEFVLSGYRYEWPEGHLGTIHLDWRRAFGWAVGLDHQFDTTQLGRGLFRVYYNEEPNNRRPKSDRPKGANINRYRVLWRHLWRPLPDTAILTDIQKLSDRDFRRELLFREEFVEDDNPESFVSIVTNDANYSLTTLLKQRMNRFDTVTEAYPDTTLTTRLQRIGASSFFSESSLGFANLQSKTAHSDSDTDVVRADWFQKLSYAMNWFFPIEVTPNIGIRQTFYTKDIQGSNREGRRDLFSGQFSAGADASLKLFRIFPVATNVLGLNVNWLRHIITPTVTYRYIHRPTVSSDLFSFPSAEGPNNAVTLGIENKLQTKRRVDGRTLKSADLGRLLIGVPYTFGGIGNKRGGRLGDWSFDLEVYPWPWLRLESDWSYPVHFVKGTRDDRITAWNLDLVMMGGPGSPQAQTAPGIQAPQRKEFRPGPQDVIRFLPAGQWYLGLGHRYSQNDKTETVLQFDVQASQKWQVGTFNRLTWKEVAAGPSKRFSNLREYQVSLRRDLHDWMAELVYRVDREAGEELFFTLTLKAFPEMPIQISDSYHQPKLGSQSSPFSPMRGQHPQ